MFKRILIANRGEIAVRVIRACRDMGIISVGVYSKADRDSLHKYLADEKICIGPASPKDSYLNMKNIISAAVSMGADAIHPGYGFLSENIEFAKMCEENSIEFIGPSYKSIALMGDKAAARETMVKAGVPVIPGSNGLVKSYKEALEISKKIGYPVMVKASNGGGGRGIRKVDREEDLKNAIQSAKIEAKANFGNDGIYIEKCILNPRHIEIQILGDKYGNVVHLYDRDCSLQRRHQKVIEESPSSFLDDQTREKMGKAAVKAAKAANYYSAGTVEFLVDKDKNFYFMEMNTRIQVEHPVTEFVTGVDLVRSQIEIADGEKLKFKQEDIKIKGHAMECRINAEDPLNNFMPTPGVIRELNIPGGLGVRVDCAIYQGYEIPPFYDSLIAKLIVFGNDRPHTIARMKRALSEFIIGDVTSNADFLMKLLNDNHFIGGNFDNCFLDNVDIKKMLSDE